MLGMVRRVSQGGSVRLIREEGSPGGRGGEYKAVSARNLGLDIAITS